MKKYTPFLYEKKEKENVLPLYIEVERIPNKKIKEEEVEKDKIIIIELF